MTKVTSTAKAAAKHNDAAVTFAADRESRYDRYFNTVAFGDGKKLPADDEMAVALNKLVEDTVIEDKDYVIINDKALEAANALETHMTAHLTEKERDDYIFSLVDLAERAENKFGNERAGKIVSVLIERINKIPAAVQFKKDELVDIGFISGAISMLPKFMLSNERIESRINKAFDNAEECVKERIEKDEKERKEKAEAAIAEAKAAAVVVAETKEVNINFVDKVKNLIEATTDLDSPEAEAMLDVVGKLNFVRLKRLEHVTLETPADEIVSIMESIGIDKEWLKEFLDTLPVDSFVSVFGQAKAGTFAKEYVAAVRTLLDEMSLEEIITFCVDYYTEFGVAASKLSGFSEKEIKAVLEWTKERSLPMFNATVKCFDLLLKSELASGAINMARYNELALVVSSISVIEEAKPAVKVNDNVASSPVAADPVNTEEEVPTLVAEPTEVAVGHAISTWLNGVVNSLATSDSQEMEYLVDHFGKLNLLKASRLEKQINFETSSTKEITTALKGAGITEAWVNKLIDLFAENQTFFNLITDKAVDKVKLADYLQSVKEAIAAEGFEGIIEFSKEYANKFGGQVENPAHMDPSDLNARLFYISENKPSLLNVCVASFRCAVDFLMADNAIESDLALAQLNTLKIYETAVENMNAEPAEEKAETDTKQTEKKSETETNQAEENASDESKDEKDNNQSKKAGSDPFTRSKRANRQTK